MGFMKMLAQNTQIDGRSRWSEAERTLQDDARFKAVPDSSDREDLFNEFVEALTKKEKVGGFCGCTVLGGPELRTFCRERECLCFCCVGVKLPSFCLFNDVPAVSSLVAELLVFAILFAAVV